MRRLFCLTIISLLSYSCSLSQTIDNWWLLGYDYFSGLPWGGTDLSFVGNNAPIITHNPTRTLQFDNAGVAINDTVGNLLFYTNGFTVCNRFNQIMPNGDTLSPSAYTAQNYDNGLRIPSGIICLPSPDHSNQFILIHQTDDDVTLPYPFYLYYSIVDMNLDSGNGDLVFKNSIIVNDTLELAQIVACKHANGRDWWVVVPERLKNNYYTILITPQGIQSVFSQSIGTRTEATGQAVFSPDGSKYASYDTYTDLEV
jgi:hypothetical protein